MLPLITVVTIGRNCRDDLLKTMKSVISQTYSNIEYIVVDGASSDGSPDAAREMLEKAKLARSKVLSERDSGISDAMNKGVGLANGQILIHLHAGDWFVGNEVLARVAESWLQHNWRWAIASSNVVDADGLIVHVYKPLADVETLIKKNGVPHQSTFLAKDIFDQHGLFKTDMHQAMDYEFWLRIAFRGDERPFTLPFVTTNFSAGGASSNLRALLKACYILRRRLPEYHRKSTPWQDLLYLARIAAFGLLQRFRRPQHNPNSAAQ